MRFRSAARIARYRAHSDHNDINSIVNKAHAAVHVSDVRAGFVAAYREAGFRIAEPLSLVQPSITTSFLFSVGFVDVVAAIAGGASSLDGAATVQRCFRHFDIDRVDDGRHLSFFEMAGALRCHGWRHADFISVLIRYLHEYCGLAPQRMRVTYFGGGHVGGEYIPADEAARDAYLNAGVRPDNLRPGNADSNIWFEGTNSGTPRSGICGPHSEVFYPLLENLPQGADPLSCPQAFIEISNLVTITHKAKGDGAITALPQPLVEQAIGMERLEMAVLGLDHIGQTPKMRAISDALQGFAEMEDRAQLFIASDHLRALVHLISDGGRPGAKGRGHVVRRMVRGLVPALEAIGFDMESGLRPCAERIAEVDADVHPGALPQVTESVQVLFDECARIGRARRRRRPGSGAARSNWAYAGDTLAQRFATVAAQYPRHRALIDADSRQLSYAELDASADRVAHALLQNCDPGASTVAVICVDEINQAIAQLAVWKAGRTCVPIDAAFPLTRQIQIIRNAQAGGVLTDSACTGPSAAPRWPGLPVIAVDKLAGETATTSVVVPVSPHAPAYILYTSGTTGEPKGVIQTHANLLRVAELYRHDLGIDSRDRVCSPTSLAYTGTIWALLGAWMNGAALVIMEHDNAANLVRMLKQQQVTVAQLIVSLLRQLLGNAGGPLDLPDLRLVYTGGECMHREDVRDFARRFPPHCRLLHDLGSTEAGIIAHLPVDPEQVRRGRDPQRDGDPAFPAGYPVPGVNIDIVDDNGKPVSSGQVGEIVVQGRFISPGYWRDEGLTRKCYTRRKERMQFRTGDLGLLRDDGCVIHLGRKDRQVKIRGYRVNLLEIEQALRALPGIRACAVKAMQKEMITRAVAYLECETGFDMNVSRIREALAARLPGYMIPARFVHLDMLPTKANGKLDYDRLPDPDAGRPRIDSGYSAPRSMAEKKLAGICARALGAHPVGRDDNLFELGADSLVMMQLIGTIHIEFGTHLDMRTVFESPTIRALARIVDGQADLKQPGREQQNIKTGDA